MVYCAHCGAPTPDDGKFCAECGKRVDPDDANGLVGSIETSTVIQELKHEVGNTQRKYILIGLALAILWFVAIHPIEGNIFNITYLDIAGMDCGSSDGDSSGFESLDDFEEDLDNWCKETKRDASILVFAGFSATIFLFWKAMNPPDLESIQRRKEKATELAAKAKELAEENRLLLEQRREEKGREREQAIIEREARMATKEPLSRNHKLLAVAVVILLGSAVYYYTNIPIDYVGADLSNQDLSGRDLSGEDLSNADLSWTVIENIDLSYAILSYANLGWSSGENANMSNAIGIGANLDQVDLPYGKFSNSDFASATIRGGLSNANFANANLWNADLSNSNLESANFANANLRNADLSYTYLGDSGNGNGVDLENANLENANLEGANLRYTDLSGVRGLDTANLENVIWDHAICPDGTDSGEGNSASCEGHFEPS